MKQEIRQNGRTILRSEEHLQMIFRNIVGRNFSGPRYHDYIGHWVLCRGFVPGPVELWIDGRMVDQGEIVTRRKEVSHE